MRSVNPRPSRKILVATILASVSAHAIVFFVIRGSPSGAPASAAPSGVVSVSFIEPVEHDRATAAPSPRSQDVVAAPPPQSQALVAAPPPRRQETIARGPTKPSARPAASASPTPAGSGRAGPGADEIGRFVAEVGRLIDARKTYPRPALSRELEGRVVVALTIGSDGSLLRSEVEEPTPYALLNDAALSAVRAVDRYPPLPAHAAETLHLHVPIVFKIKH